MDIDIQSLALVKVVKDGALKVARSNVKAGRYPVDFTARVTGTLSVAKDGSREIRTAVDHKKTLAALCDALVQSGAVAGEVIDDVIRSAMETAVSGEVNETMLFLVAEADIAVTSVVNTLPCKGRVTTSLQVEFCDPMDGSMEVVQ